MKKVFALFAVMALAGGVAYANFCAKDIVPAATLLVPYAVVDADPVTGDPDPNGYTTILVVTNTSAARQIIHVHVWNMFSDTVVDFSEILSGYDVWSINFRDFINADFNLFDTYVEKSTTYPQGYLGTSGFFNTGATGPAVAPWGPTVNRTQSSDPDWPELPGSEDIGTGDFAAPSIPPGSCPPHFPKLTGGLKEYYRDVVIRGVLADVAAWPQRARTTLDCRADLDVTNTGTWLASFSPYPYTFYVTVDTVGACTTYFPTDGEYWTTIVQQETGFLRNNNVLIGYVYYVNFNQNFSEALPAVHLERDADWATDTVTGFYDQYANASNQEDRTEPLGNAYAINYYTGGGMSSDLIVWKDVADVVQVGTNFFFDACRRFVLYAWDEDEQFRSQTTQGGISPAPTAPGQVNVLPFETQKVPVNYGNFPAMPGANGWFLLIFDSANLVNPLQAPDTQAYVAMKYNYGGYSMTAEAALMANTLCFGRRGQAGQPEANLQTYFGNLNSILGFGNVLTP